jgi:lipid-A-disaccharide synthase
VAHVGHPLLDELAARPSGQAGAAPVIAVLPGSRERVIDLNFPWMLRLLALVRRRFPDLEAMVLQDTDRHRRRIEGHIRDAGAPPWARLAIGDIHERLPQARAAFSVSGTVLLDVLHHRLPTVCVYRVSGPRGVWMYRHALVTPFFASVNLLAGHQVVPEFCFQGDGPIAAVVAALERTYGDDVYRQRVIQELALAAERLGPGGATRRAALHALDLARLGAPGAPGAPGSRLQASGSRLQASGFRL